MGAEPDVSNFNDAILRVDVEEAGLAAGFAAGVVANAVEDGVETRGLLAQGGVVCLWRWPGSVSEVVPDFQGFVGAVAGFEQFFSME